MTTLDTTAYPFLAEGPDFGSDSGKEAGLSIMARFYYETAFSREEATLFADRYCNDLIASIPALANQERVAALLAEYRPTLNVEVLHSWAQDLVKALTPSDEMTLNQDGQTLG